MVISDKKIHLGKRLTQIESMVTEHYDHIWDCCCDHGLLGATLLARHAAPTIHFVDIVAELMHDLENKLHRFYPQDTASIASAQWQVHCMDITALPLQKTSGKHLVIIAGVGGDLMTAFISAIRKNNPDTDIDFLLCPVHHQFTLRRQLIQLNFRLKTEALILENHRHYEILLVATTGNINANINPVGSLIWQYSTPEQAEIATDYLQKTLAHYRRIQQGNRIDVQHIIDRYSEVTITPATTTNKSNDM